jgi:hypothetical protein
VSWRGAGRPGVTLAGRGRGSFGDCSGWGWDMAFGVLDWVGFGVAQG